MIDDLDPTDERIARALREATPADGDLIAPPADLWSRIVADLGDELESAPAAGPSPVHPTGPAGTAPAVIGVVPLASRRRSRRRWAPAAAAAAAVLLIVGGVVVATRRSTDPAEVVARAALTGDGLPDGVADPGAAKLVRQNGEWFLSVDAPDLPKSAPGSFYEVWLLGPGVDRVQSLGAIDREGKFLVPAGIDLARFPKVDVSVEPLDGNPEHSTKSVLRGDLERA